MDEDALNLQIRRFLKKVGISSQRELEKAVRAADEAGTLAASVPVSVTLRAPGLDVELTIDDTLELG